MDYHYQKDQLPQQDSNIPAGSPYHNPYGTSPTGGAYQPHEGTYQPHEGAYQQPYQAGNTYRASYEAPGSVSYQPQGGDAPGGGKKKGGPGKVVGGIALVLACALAGFGGGAIAYSSMGGGNQTVVYKAPEDAGSQAAGVSTGEDLSLSDIASKAKESVVSITTENVVADFMSGGRIVSGAGSGVIISEDGTILTNNHVISGANSVIVTLPDGSEHEATLVGTDAASDVAVIKIDVTGLTPAVIGNSDELDVGEFCLAIGNPMGTLGGTVTDGIISALNREINIDGQPMNLLQMSAAVSPGNSGGGLFNSKGELIGIVNAKSGGEDVEGLGFAIPVNTAVQVADELITNGYVTGRPALGISVRSYTIEDFAAAGKEAPGLYVEALNPGGAAEKAGLQVGDRIVSADGNEIQSHADLSTVLSEHAVGDEVEITVFRDGRQMSFQVALEELGAAQ